MTAAEAERERYQRRKLDPEFMARKAAYARAWKLAKAGDPTALEAHRAKRAKHEAEARAVRERLLAERARYRAQSRERAARNRRMSKTATEPMTVQLRQIEMERIDAVACEIRALERGPCGSTVTRRGFRISCIAQGDHRIHVGPHGDRW